MRSKQIFRFEKKEEKRRKKETETYAKQIFNGTEKDNCKSEQKFIETRIESTYGIDEIK